MKKVLLGILLLLLVVLAGYTIFSGIKIGNFEILSIGAVKEKDQELETKISETNALGSVSYPQKMSELKSASTKMLEAKQSYLDLTTTSTPEQISKATVQESFSIEFLWMKVGGYARAKGVNIKMEIKSGDSTDVNNLNFTVNGSYIGIINFISSIENDSKLNFRIQGFKLIPSSGYILQATFSVKNVRISGNTSSQAVTPNTNTTNENSTTKTNTVNNTVNNNTTNTNNTTDANTTNSVQ